MPSATPLYNFLYSGDLQADYYNLLNFVEGFYKDLEVPSVNISSEALNRVFTGMLMDFPHPTGTQKSSPFKKVAAFSANFVAEKPIVTPLPDAPFGHLASHQNAIIAFELSRAALHGAIINCKVRGELKLENPIMVSQHYWKDLIVCLSKCIPSSGFEAVSLIFEALAYNANPNISYERTV